MEDQSYEDSVRGPLKSGLKDGEESWKIKY